MGSSKEGRNKILVQNRQSSVNIRDVSYDEMNNRIRSGEIGIYHV